MKSKRLRSWTIPPDLHSFYPTAMRCVGYGQEYAISIFSAHTIVTLIFPYLSDAIENDKKPLKYYLHKNLQPDVISNIVTCQNESLVLFANGTVKIFKSPKKLEMVRYWSDVKAICSCEYGFAMIKLTDGDRKVVMEFHPDSFTANDVTQRRIFDISFDEHSGLESTWRNSRYTISELVVSAALFAFIRNEPEKVDDSKRVLFFSVDCNLFLFQPIDDRERIDDTDHEISHVASFSSNIVHFWLSNSGEAVILELESEAVSILYPKRDENRLECQTLFLAMNIEASIFFNDIFAYSDGRKVEWGKLALNEVSGKFEYSRSDVNLVGISAMAFLESVNGMMCVSENRLFYIIPMDASKEKSIPGRFIEINESLNRHLNGVRHEIKELTDVYENLRLQLICQQEVYSILKLKESNQLEKNYFVAFVKPVILATHNKTFTVTLTNSVEQCKTPTFLTNISIFAATYSPEFQTNMWNVRCRFRMADGSCNHINVKLTKDELIQPFDLLVQSDEPIASDIQIEINTIVKIGGHFIYLAFPVKTKILGDLKNSLKFISPTSNEWSRGSNMKNSPMIVKFDQHITYQLCYTMQFHKPISIEKLHEIFNLQTNSRDFQNPHKWSIALFDKPITLEYEKKNRTLRIKCNDAHVMYFMKMLLYVSVEKNGGNGFAEVMQLSPSIFQEYCVSIEMSSKVRNSMFISRFFSNSRPLKTN